MVVQSKRDTKRAVIGSWGSEAVEVAPGGRQRAREWAANATVS
jgi:hypothetical protein